MKSAETERSDRGCCVFTNPYPFKNETTLEETDPYFQSVLLTPYETYMKQKRATSGESSNALNWMQIFILVQARGLAAQSSCSTPPQIHTVSVTGTHWRKPQGHNTGRLETYLPRKHLGNVVSLRFRSLMRFPLVMRW